MKLLMARYTQKRTRTADAHMVLFIRHASVFARLWVRMVHTCWPLGHKFWAAGGRVCVHSAGSYPAFPEIPC